MPSDASYSSAITSRSRRRWLRAASGFAASAGLSGWLPQAHANSLTVGQPAPALVLRTLDGREIDTRTLLGQVVILTFWATWCEPCNEELPLLSAYAQRHAREGLQILGFSLDAPENLPMVRKIADRLSFPVGLLGSAYAGGYGRIWRLPVNFAIDRSGRLAHNGWEDPAPPAWTAERLATFVTPLLQAPR